MEMGYLQGEFMKAKGDMVLSEGLFVKLQSVYSHLE